MNEMLDNTIYKAKIKLMKIFYPKGVSQVNDGEYAIFSAKKIDSNDLINEIKLKGTVCHLDNKSEYNVAYRLKDDNQYGKTYEILYISRSIDTSSLDGQKEFLKVFLNENIVDKLFDTYGNDVRNILENKDIEKLKQINGIGEYKAKKIIDEFNRHKTYELVYQELKDLNLTPKMVSKLVEYYKSPEIVIQTIKNDVYSLVNIDGIGFKKADEIAISSGIGFTDYRRIKGFILYYLKIEGESGKSYVTYNELCKAIEDNLGKIDYNEFNKSAKKLIDSKKIIVLDNGNKIALTEMYELEKNIYQELVRLNSYKKDVTQADIERVEKAITTSEEIQGFSFTDEQKQAIRDSIYHNVIAITGGAGCVDCDTEFLSQNGWKKISDYNENDLVLQYNDNGTTEFVEPLRYIKRLCKFLNYVHNDALNMCISDNHICYYMSSDNMLKSKPFDQIRELHYKEDRQGFGGKFLCGFNNLGIGLNISDDILRLYTIIIMRGKYISQNGNKYLCSIRVKELHNYKRSILVQSLNNLKIKFVERNKKLGFSDIIFYMNEKILDFPKEWYGLNSYQFNIILDIIRNYSNRHNSYKSLRNDIHFTSQAFYNKSIADFVQ